MQNKESHWIRSVKSKEACGEAQLQKNRDGARPGVCLD